MRTISLLALLALVSPCASATAQQMPSVTIARVADKHWRATFRLNAPATSLRFDRPAAFFRERVWQISTPGYRFARQGDQQYVSLDSGATPKRDIVFEFPEFTDPLTKEYELFQPFSDGAVAMYTGHFHALAIGTVAADSSRVRYIRIQTPPGAHAIVQGRVREGVVAFTDSLDDGTYVYLGHAEPIETPDIVAVVDPGMPAWLKDAFDRNLPALFHEYASRLGASLPFKPTVYFSFDEKGSGRSSGGGTLTGLLNMTLAGSDWRTQTPAAAEQAFWLVAHESAHLWNGQLVRNADDGPGSWMHEGSADAMAGEMLLAFGVIDTARYRARRDEAFNRCVAAVSAGSVETAIRRGATQAVYDCGAVMSVWTEAAARNVKPDASLFSFWRALIAHARARGAYDKASYFSTLAALGVADSTIARMRSFLVSHDSAGVLIAGLEAAGVAVRVGQGEPPPAYQRDLARAAMIHLMQQACTRVDFRSGSPMNTGAVAGCAPFANEMQVYRIQGFRVRDQGAALYDGVRAACDVNEALPFQGEDGTTLVTVPCTKPLAARTPWYELGGTSP